MLMIKISKYTSSLLILQPHTFFTVNYFYAYVFPLPVENIFLKVKYQIKFIFIFSKVKLYWHLSST